MRNPFPELSYRVAFRAGERMKGWKQVSSRRKVTPSVNGKDSYENYSGMEMLIIDAEEQRCGTNCSRHNLLDSFSAQSSDGESNLVRWNRCMSSSFLFSTRTSKRRQTPCCFAFLLLLCSKSFVTRSIFSFIFDAVWHLDKMPCRNCSKIFPSLLSFPSFHPPFISLYK